MVKNKILFGFLIVGILMVLVAGFQPNPYLIKVRNIQPPHPYPWEVVGCAIGLMLVHTLISKMIIKTRSLVRVSLALLICTVFLVIGMVGSMHAPLAWVIYVVWVGQVTILMGGYFLKELYVCLLKIL